MIHFNTKHFPLSFLTGRRFPSCLVPAEAQVAAGSWSQVLQVSVELWGARTSEHLRQSVTSLLQQAVSRRHVLNRALHLGSEGPRSGCEEDEYLQPLKTGRQRLFNLVHTLYEQLLHHLDFVTPGQSPASGFPFLMLS